MEYTTRVKSNRVGWCLGLVACLWTGVAWAAMGDRAVNVILFIGDGMGMEQVKAARLYQGAPLCFETFPNFALVDTLCRGGQITDSAAGSTAIATGTRVDRDTYGDRSKGQLPTILEYYKGKGKRTGLVTTDAMTAATPAAFATYAMDRNDKVQIASNYLFQTRPNVLLGGGGFEMTPELAAMEGYVVVSNVEELADVDLAATSHLSGQFGVGQMPYEWDGIGDFPHLWEMTVATLTLLEQESHGFFLLVEGANIDHAAHDMDLLRLIPEMMAFNEAVQVALNWASNRTDTLILVTADHETRGLRVLADNGAGNLPDVEWTDDWHTDTPVGCWAWGPGSERVNESTANTNTFFALRDAALLKTVCIGTREGEEHPTPVWAAAPFDTFRIEYSDSIESPEWKPLGVGTASSDSFYLADTNVWPQAQRFYRATAVP